MLVIWQSILVWETCSRVFLGEKLSFYALLSKISKKTSMIMDV